MKKRKYLCKVGGSNTVNRHYIVRRSGRCLGAFRFLGILILGVVALHAGSGRYELTDDDIFLKTEQRIDLTLYGGIGQNPCGLLERSSGEE